MRIALIIALCVLPLVATERVIAEDQTPSAQSIRDSYRARLNDNTVTIMAGSSQATDLAVVQDIADVLDDGAVARRRGDGRTLRGEERRPARVVVEDLDDVVHRAQTGP